MKDIGRSYTTETLKAAIAQSTLNDEQIKAILSANGFRGELLKTTTDELANAASTNAVAASQAETTATTLGLGTAFTGLWISIKKATVAMAKFLFTTPQGWATLAAGAIIGVTIAAVNYNKQLEENKKKIREAAEEAKSAIDTIKSDFDTLSSDTDKIKNKYAELAQQVENLGKVNQSRGKLSTEDYEEFLGLSNQLAQLFPQLTKGYDDNGNAILDLSGNVDTIVGSLDNLVSVQQKLANQKILENMPDVWAGYMLDVNEYKRDLTDMEKMSMYAIKAISRFSSNEKTLYFSHENQNDDISFIISEALRNLGYDPSKMMKQTYYYDDAPGYQKKIIGVDTEWDFSSLDETQFEQFKNQLDIISREYEDAVMFAKGKIDSANSNMASYINTWLSGEWNFSRMNSDMRNVVKDVLINSDWISSIPDDINAGDWEEVSNWLQQHFLFAINNIDSEEINTALVDAFNGNISADALQSIVDKLIKTEGFDENNPLIIYLQTKIENRTNLENSVKSKVRPEFSDMVVGLSDDELQIAAEKIEVQEGTLLSWDELITKIRKVQDSISNNKSPASFSDIFAIEDAESNLNALGELTEQLDKIKSAYSNLKNAMDSYSSTGSITIEQFQSIIEQGDDFLDYLTLEDGQLGINEQAMYDLAKARIAEMKAQAIQGVVDNVSKIETEADADSYLASTNYDLADSYHTLAEAQLIAWSTSALEKGLSQDYVDKVTNKARNDINKIRALVNKVDFKNFSGASSSSAAEQAEKDWKNVLDKETDLLEKQLAANIITFQEYTDKRRQIVEDYYRDGKIRAEEYYDALESMYNHQISLYDRVVNAVTDRIDDEIDKLKDQKEAIENSYQAKIDAIQEEIDALNKANDARQEQIDLEKAQYEAERARNQRVNKVYNGSQFVYEADMDAVRDAEDDLADKEFQLNISRLETQIELLKEEMENATKSLDNQIDALEAYKDKWNEISDVYQKQQDKLLAAEIMGSEWERDILNGRLDTLRSFTEQYIALQQAQIDIAAKAAKIKAEAEAGNTTGGDGDNPPKDPPKDPPKYGVVYEGTAKAVRIFDTKAEAQSYANYMNKVHYRDEFMYYVKQYASGTDNARKGLNLVGENGTETFIDNDGNVSLVTKPTLIPMEGGEVVKNAEETKAMLDTGNIEPVQSEGMRALFERIRNMQPSDFSFQSLMQPLSAMVNFPNMDYSHMLSNTSAEPTPVVQHITLTLPNVTNNSGADYLIKTLERLPLDNLQHMHRRKR
ncbi:MAG: hypothetical protein HDR08_10505 [Lachnospiraceae bacterium]|nr:hypothetical protein [Lachnospiraceae bacterium]MBD5511668.1 hypothetical protein [Lachnospiraceae bacterium]